MSERVRVVRTRRGCGRIKIRNVSEARGRDGEERKRKNICRLVGEEIVAEGA